MQFWVAINGKFTVATNTQGKIERWHQTLKNRILLENYFLLGELEQQIEMFVNHYNHRRYHESLNKLTQPTFTSGAGNLFWQNETGSNERLSRNVVCTINDTPRNMKMMSKTLP